jgi:ribonucleoside-diphosphate reductase alpha chain
MTSITLQYGVPLKALVDKFSHTRFEPSGFTNNREIPIAKSITDYVFRYLGNRYIESEAEVEVAKTSAASDPGSEPAQSALGAVAGGSGQGPTRSGSSFINQADAPSCMDCGTIMIRNGACYKCPTCGSTSGCS